MILLKLNTLKLGVFFYFIAYGYYGAVVPINEGFGDISFSLLLTFFLAIFFIIYSKIPRNIVDEFDLAISVKKIEVYIFGCFSIFIFILLYDKLQYSLYSDELSYAKSAHGHAMVIVMYLSKFDFASNIEAKILVRTISVVLLLHLYFVWRIIDKNKYIAIVVILFVVYRLLFDFRGGNANPHPPLELLPIFMSGSFFGLSNFGLKMSYFLTYLLFHAVIYTRIKSIINPMNAAILVVAVGFIPVIFKMSTIIEHAIWGYFFTSIIVLEIIRPGGIQLNKIIPLIAIGVLFRQSILVLILPVMMLYFWQNGLSNLYKKNFYLSFLILIIALPIFLSSLINGTPVTNSISDTDFIGSISNIFDYSFMLDSFRSVFSFFWIPVFLFAFIPTDKKDIPATIAIIFLFLIFYTTYHLIDKDAWSIAKYKIEYFAPFLFLGLVTFLKKFTSQINKYVLSGVLTLLVVLNFVESSMIADQSCSGPNYYASGTYNYNNAYKDILEMDGRGSTYSIGATYGVLPELIAGYSASELSSARKLYSSIDRSKITYPISESDIQYVFTNDSIRYILLPKNLVSPDVDLYKNLNFNVVPDEFDTDYCSGLYILNKN